MICSVKASWAWKKSRNSRHELLEFSIGHASRLQSLAFTGQCSAVVPKCAGGFDYKDTLNDKALLNCMFRTICIPFSKRYPPTVSIDFHTLEVNWQELLGYHLGVSTSCRSQQFSPIVHGTHHARTFIANSRINFSSIFSSSGVSSSTLDDSPRSRRSIPLAFRSSCIFVD